MGDGVNYAYQYARTARLVALAYRANRDFKNDAVRAGIPLATYQNAIRAAVDNVFPQEISEISRYEVVASTADPAFLGKTGLNAILLKAPSGSFAVSISGVDRIFDPSRPVGGLI